MLNPERFFEGKACKKCGGTKRYKKGGNCVPCGTTYHRVRSHRTRFDPCITCGQDKRGKLSNRCTACVYASTAKLPCSLCGGEKEASIKTRGHCRACHILTMSKLNTKKHGHSAIDATVDQIKAFLKNSNNMCSICKATTTKPKIDHDHQTGALREVLCHSCNTGIGYAGENITTLKKFLDYLVKERIFDFPDLTAYNVSKRSYKVICNSKHYAKLNNHKPLSASREQIQYLLDTVTSCQICNRHEATNKQRLHVDHCHISGKLRGILCLQCNSALGSFKDDPNIIKSAISYLIKHNANPQHNANPDQLELPLIPLDIPLEGSLDVIIPEELPEKSRVKKSRLPRLPRLPKDPNQLQFPFMLTSSANCSTPAATA